MDKKQELDHMRNSLKNSKIIQGVAMTPPRERMLEREMAVVRIIGGYRGASPAHIESSALVSERMSSRGTLYKPTGGNELSTYAVDMPGTGCALLPEAIGPDGYIHVQSEHGMNLGILVGRAMSPILGQKGHTTRTVQIDYACEVNGSPLVYSESGRHSGDYALASRGIESPQRAEALLITGEDTFLDVLPGRIRMEGSTVTGITEILSDKSKGYSGKPDLVLVLKGAVLPANEEIGAPNELPAPRSRGASLGDTVNTDYQLGSTRFNASTNPLNTYTLEFVFD